MNRNTSIIVLLLLIGLIGYTIYDDMEGRAREKLLLEQAVYDDVIVGHKVGQRAPHIEGLDLAGDKVQLSDYRGKKVLVNFWATWCSPCRDEMPDMQQIYEDYSDEVELLGVNLTMAELSIEGVRDFVEETGVTFPIILDQDGEALNAYRVIVYPTTFALDEAGIIREVFFGAIDYETMQHTLDSI